MLGYSVVNQKGQVTVPSRIRKDLGIKPEDRVVVSRVTDGVLIKLSPSIVSLRGSIKAKTSPENFKKMRSTFEDYLSQRKND